MPRSTWLGCSPAGWVPEPANKGRLKTGLSIIPKEKEEPESISLSLVGFTAFSPGPFGAALFGAGFNCSRLVVEKLFSLPSLPSSLLQVSKCFTFSKCRWEDQELQTFEHQINWPGFTVSKFSARASFQTMARPNHGGFEESRGKGHIA